MPTKKPHHILTDLGGYGLIILGILLAPVPGPGGLPLMLLGLSLLSIHNDWAAKIRESLINHGHMSLGYLFPDKKEIKLIYDALVLVIATGLAVYLTSEGLPSNRIAQALVIATIAGTIMVFLANRKRGEKLKKRLRL